MPFIPRQVKPPARVPVTYKLPAALATVLKHYAEFLDSSQEYVVAETLRVAFRRDKEFQTWLTATYPGARLDDAPRETAARDAQPEPTARRERERT